MVATSPPEPVFPPVFTGHAVETGREPIDAAVAAASTDMADAGDIFWSRATDRAAAAIVLEPEVALSSALQMAPALMVATGDALGALGPPSLPVTYRWPVTLLVNAGRAGGVALAAPRDTALSQVPDRLVVGFDLALRFPDGVRDPGLDPDVTVLHEEGCGDIDSRALIGAVARHFLTWVDTWLQDGFRPVHRAWVTRAEETGRWIECALPAGRWAGTMVGLDEEGGLILNHDGEMISVPLAAAMERY
ncbi:biotin/lipoate--protein ligase family protein [Mesorhizobium xinjiangense]|uniref:biotin/lipoate--protein ligase family protein n=1 Tax=Mesorhizobium xinjiangense TaxID=2678685 RepID=UPI001F48B038|nr:biotin/lipoate--protein ligase family protein [Mesorhizobium xinjiangense]